MRIISAIRTGLTFMAWGYFTLVVNDPASPAISIIANLALLYVYANIGLSTLRYMIEDDAFISLR